MRKNLWSLLLIGFAFTLGFSSCSDDDDDDLVGNWVELSDFEGIPRYDAVSFTIGDRVFMGTGFDGDEDVRLNDFWEYIVEKDYWVRRADFPGVARNGAVAFASSTKGYIGTGYDGDNKLNDFYAYDPESDSWSQVADFTGTARYGALAFSINNKGYVGTGYDGNVLKDLYEYDPSSNTWNQKVSVGGSKRRDAFVFVIDDIAYVGGGLDNGSYEDDFHSYNPTTDTWTQLNDITDGTSDSFDDDYETIMGSSKVTFTISGLGYVATGGYGSAGNTIWEYDPEADLWTEKYSLEGTSRLDAIGFSYGNRGYIATGRNGSYYFDDVWAFEPNAEYNEYD